MTMNKIHTILLLFLLGGVIIAIGAGQKIMSHGQEGNGILILGLAVKFQAVVLLLRKYRFDIVEFLKR